MFLNQNTSPNSIYKKRITKQPFGDSLDNPGVINPYLTDPGHEMVYPKHGTMRDLGSIEEEEIAQQDSEYNKSQKNFQDYHEDMVKNLDSMV